MVFLEKLDLILLIAGGVLVVVSVVVNIISSARLGNLSESINQFEAKFEAKSASDRRPPQNDSRTGRAGEKFDSSVLPSAEPSGSDSRHGTRYRPPGSRVKVPDSAESSEEGSGSVPPPTRHINIGKAGVRLPADEPSAEDGKSAGVAVAGEEQVSVSEAKAAEEPPRSSPASASKKEPVKDAPLAESGSLAGSDKLSQDDQALLQEYLGSRAGVSGEKADAPEPDLADAGTPRNGQAAEDDGDVMEVVEDTRFMQKTAPAPEDIINPFDHTQHSLDMGRVLEPLSRLKSGATLNIDFQDVLFLIDEEIDALSKVYRQCRKQGITLAVRNVQRNVQSDLHAKFPELKIV